MPLLKDLLDAYENIEKNGHPIVSFPTVWHENKLSDIEIMIDTRGNFLKARRLERWIEEKNEDGKKIKVKGDAEALTPVTLYSECRTGSQAAPRPVSDKIKYFLPEREGVDGKFLSATKDLLDRWNLFAGGNTKLKAIYRYISEGTIRNDLLGSGALDDKPEAKRESLLPDLTARFVISGDNPEKPWEDEDLIRSWDNFMESQAGELVTDVVTGREDSPAHKHGKNILPDNANGKLISTSMSESFIHHMTGERFTETDQAPFVTWRTSVKAHRMLRWLIKNRSVRVSDKGSTTYWTCFSKTEPVHMDYDAFAQESGQSSSYGRILRDAINGKAFDIPDDDLTVLAMDYSSDGRDSVVYYQSVSSNEFFKTLLKWREKYRVDTRDGYFYPSLRQIVMHAFGSYDNRTGGLYLNEAIMKKYLNDLMKCFLEGKDIPENIVNSCAGNVSRTSHSQEVMRDILRTACTLLVGGGNTMNITDPDQSRSFLYGRLLAVFDTVEEAAVYKQNLKRSQERKIDRPTNAKKMWSAYTSDPETISARLYGKVTAAYLSKLSKSSRDYYDSLIGGIYEMLSDKEKRGQQLSPEYIIGYTQQKNELRKRSREIKEKLSEGGKNNE